MSDSSCTIGEAALQAWRRDPLTGKRRARGGGEDTHLEKSSAVVREARWPERLRQESPPSVEKQAGRRTEGRARKKRRRGGRRRVLARRVCSGGEDETEITPRDGLGWRRIPLTPGLQSCAERQRRRAAKEPPSCRRTDLDLALACGGVDFSSQNSDMLPQGFL